MCPSIIFAIIIGCFATVSIISNVLQELKYQNLEKRYINLRKKYKPMTVGHK